ncbi:glycine zipper 2TM domain-containing protein [Duganella sp. FT92W]|uniref:Glycine zipper 2TM domain-containing protein n=1 Tax=Pseudoduganella rivuli TaxID=2666085 RepID=A0A7X2IUW0_9BURK|nr:glycine zipper 2TM domain-containing protein [Pseudoduganella rivuli]MRV76370.1 glycine zipper 2TM domain-containing protein [Pseudoduganella rivuli]
MNIRTLTLSLMLAGLSAGALAQPTAKEVYAADTKKAAARYAEDKKLCSEEKDSGARMQCQRDAKAEYDKALAAAKSHLNAANPKAVACNECGRVVGVNVVEKKGEGSAVGVIAGGVAGALLGNQVGGGSGKKLATIAGAAGGAYAGNKVEEHMKTTKQWHVKVQFDNGTQGDFTFAKDPGFANGDLVKETNHTVVRR